MNKEDKKRRKSVRKSLIAAAVLPAMLSILPWTGGVGIVYAQENGSNTEQISEGELIEIEKEESEEVIPAENLLPDEEILLEQYIEETVITMSSCDEAVSSEIEEPRASARYWKLGSAEKKAYLAIREYFRDISSGKESSSVIKISFGDIFSDEKYSAADLGINAVVQDNQITQDAVQAVSLKYDLDTNKLFNALTYDCPELMYWFDKTQGMYSECSYSFKVGYSSNVGWTIWCDAADSIYTFRFCVSEEYAGGGEFTVDTVKTGAVTTAISNAGDIVEKAKDRSDHDKLIYYRDRICQLVSYNEAAVDETLEEPVPYGNPWQLIYVFDDIDETNVVCEGYSKAFKLLCDSTKFDNSSIDCSIVTGYMDGGKGAGGHMWNLVSVDGKNYIADITNCDSGTIGYPDKLFLKGNTNGTAESYAFPISTKTILYSYDASTLDMYSAEERILAMSDYTPPVAHVHTWNEGVVTKEASCEEDGEKTYTCINCNATRTESIESLGGHAWNEGVVTKEAGCLEKGEKTFTCNHCGITRTEEIESLGGHAWNEGVVTKEAGCLEKGEKTFNCNHCGITRTEEIHAHDHVWDDGEVTKEATCVEKGVFTYTCTHDASHKKTEDIPETNNHISGSAVIENRVEATTEKAGSYDEVVYCTVCRKELSRKTYSVPKLAKKVTPPTAKAGLIYNGKTQTGVVEGNEYSVTSGAGANAGSYTAVAELKDKENYTWSDGTTADKKITWKISPASITSVTAAAQTYNGSAKTPVPTVKAGTLAVPVSGYSVTYSSNKNAGTATVKVTGKGNYTGTATATFKINPASIAKAAVTGLVTKTYTGKAFTQTETVKLGGVTLKKGTDYTVAYKNNIKAGTATMTVTGKGNYTGTVTKTFKINAASIAKATVSGIVNKNYTGKVLTQNVTVKLGTVTLKKGTDYTVTYKNNTKVGTATITITGKGNYAGTISKTFKINLSGTYRIASQVNKGFSMEVAGGSKANGANIRLNKNATANAQKFTVTKVGSYYKIINKASGKAVEIKGAAIANKSNIQSNAYNKAKAQLWTIRQNADGSFTFVSALNSSYVIDLSGGKAVAGQNIQLYKSNNANAQKWILTAI